MAKEQTAPVHVQTHRLTPARWPRGLRLRIVMVADLHACWPWMPLRRVHQIVAQANALGGDFVALMGDYPGHVWGGQALEPRPVAKALAELQAPLGVRAVFGNHDWTDDPQARATRSDRTLWHDAFDVAGIAYLNNAADRLRVGGITINLAGLASQRAFKRRFVRPIEGAHDLDTTLKGCDPDLFTLMLAHEPDIFPDLPDWVDLTLSGHTHGGQILIGGRPRIVPSVYGTRFAYGVHDLDQRALVVSGGLGLSGPPLRWGVPPELTVVELS